MNLTVDGCVYLNGHCDMQPWVRAVCTFIAMPGSTQPCIPLRSLNRVPASAGVRARMSPLSGGSNTVLSYMACEFPWRCGDVTLRFAISLICCSVCVCASMLTVLCSGWLECLLLSKLCRQEPHRSADVDVPPGSNWSVTAHSVIATTTTTTTTAPVQQPFFQDSYYC